MDVLRKELNDIYSSQRLDEETLAPAILEMYKERVLTAVFLENDCRIITNASADAAYIYGGRFARLLGLNDGENIYCAEVDSSDEDEIYDRMHPEDLVDKRMLEYEYFKYVNNFSGAEKQSCKATCRIRIKNRKGEFMYVDNTTRVLHPSPRGKIWLILCTYSLSSDQTGSADIAPRIIDEQTGAVLTLSLNEKRRRILTEREKEILLLIRDGKLSKQIADMLDISIHTVNRHRQNILEKLSVGNSVEAVRAAVEMRLL